MSGREELRGWGIEMVEKTVASGVFKPFFRAQILQRNYLLRAELSTSKGMPKIAVLHIRNQRRINVNDLRFGQNHQ